MKRLWLSVLFFILIILSGCEGSNNSAPTQNYTVTPINKQLYVLPGQQVDFSVTPDDPTITNFSWSATGGAPQTGDTMSFSWNAPLTIGSYKVKVTIAGATSSWTVQVCNQIDILNIGIYMMNSLNNVATLLPGATIEILTGVGTYLSITDEFGIAAFQNVPNAPIYFKVSKSGYATYYHWLGCHDFEGYNVQNSYYLLCTLGFLESQAAPLDIDHNKSILISWVEDKQGNRIEGAAITISPSNGTLCYIDSSYHITSNATTTFVNGTFYFFDVKNGTYTITASKNGKTFSSSQITVTEPAIYYICPIFEK